MIYQYQERAYHRRQRRASFLKQVFKVFFFLFLVFGIMTASFRLLYSISQSASASESDTLISPLAEPLPQTEVATDSADDDTEELDAIVKEALQGTKGTYSIAIKHVKTGELYYQNQHKEYDAASLYKLWIMLTVFDQVKKGTLKEETKLSDSAENLNKRFGIDEENAEVKEGGFTMSVSEALEKMITISHNYAALLLSSKVRLSTVTKQLSLYNLTESKLNPPKTTAWDIANFYDKLYKGELIDREYSNKMIDLLARQQLNDRIPKYLPKGTKIAHKTGELGGVKHDAGIVYTDKGDYIIVMMSESNNPKDAAEREALLSKAVYEYFQHK